MLIDANCAQIDLSSALNIVSKAINNNNTLPVLNNVLIEAKDNHLYFSATNLEIAIKTSIKATVKTEGAITIPAKLLTSYIQLLDKQNIVISTTRDYSLELTADHDFTKIKGIKAEDFPLIPEITPDLTVEVTSELLLGLLSSVSFAASIQSTKPVLSGVYFKFSGKNLILAATDSYRLAENKIELKSEFPENSFILPVRTAIELIKILEIDPKAPVIIKIAKNQIEFHVKEIVLISRLIEGVFPDYQKIIPREEKSKIFISSSVLSQAIRKISLFARENNNNMKLTLDNDSLTISTDETKVGEGEIVIPVKKEGELNQIAVNSAFLLDVLNNYPTKEVELIINEKLSPLVIKKTKSQDYVYIIMPLKV